MPSRRNVFVFFNLFIFWTTFGLVLAEPQNVQPLSEQVTSESTQEKDLLTPSDVSLAERNITAIEIVGNKAISHTAILSKIKSRPGSPYQEAVITEDIKRLHALGYFSDIKIETQDQPEGVKLVIRVVERPLIEKITFSGMKRLKTRQQKIKEQFKTKEGQYLDYPNLNEDILTLKKMYEKYGFSNVEINYNLVLDEQTNKAKLEFIIDEKQKLSIRKIIIEGNQVFSDARILKLMKTKRAWLFNPGVLKEEVFKEDIERIKSFYQKHGYADVELDYSVSTDKTRPFLLVSINIKEGQKYIVGDVSITGNQQISEKTILASLKEILPGKVFSQEGLKKDLLNIQTLYVDQGYLFCQIQESTSLNPQTNRVDVRYRIIENEIVYVNKIKIRGNVKTRDLVIRRELRIKPGERFDGTKLKRSMDRLRNLGFFKDITYDTEDTGLPNKQDLIVEVEEAYTGSFSVGGGFSSVEKFVGFVELEQRNFDWKNFPYFTGAGQNLKLRASTGSVSSGFDLSFTEPWLFDYPISFGFDAYRRNRERETDIGYGYDESITGGALRLGREITEYLRIDSTYRFDRLKISNISSDASADLKSELGTNDISSLELALTFDSRDNVFDTKKGNLITNSLQIAGGPFGADKDFWKTYLRVSHYLPLIFNSVLELRGRAGLVKPYGDSLRVPLYERFYAGGAYTIRGYDERKVGPIDPLSRDPLGGEAMLIGNIEYLYPLLDFLKLAAFYDVGNVWSKASDFGNGNFKSGLGVGLRIKTPIGPVVLDYGIPLDIEPGETDKKSGRLHFRMSHGF